jgi:hypothetical protein
MVGQYDWRDFTPSELILDAAEFKSLHYRWIQEFKLLPQP